MAERTPQKRVIGRFEYQVIPLGGKEGTKALARLLRIVGSTAGAKSEEEAFGKILASLEEVDLEYFIDLFGKYTQVHIGVNWPGLESIYDAHFVGEYLELLGWLKFALEVNFAGFFAGMGGLGALGMGKSPSPSSSPTESTAATGSSGA